MLSMTMVMMMTKLATSPVAADSAGDDQDDDQRVTEPGENCSQSGKRLTVEASLAP